MTAFMFPKSSGTYKTPRCSPPCSLLSWEEVRTSLHPHFRHGNQGRERWLLGQGQRTGSCRVVPAKWQSDARTSWLQTGHISLTRETFLCFCEMTARFPFHTVPCTLRSVCFPREPAVRSWWLCGHFVAQDKGAFVSTQTVSATKTQRLQSSQMCPGASYKGNLKKLQKSVTRQKYLSYHLSVLRASHRYQSRPGYCPKNPGFLGMTVVSNICRRCY